MAKAASRSQSPTGRIPFWLTNQLRKDKDEAVFGEMSFDFTDKLTGTAGLR